MKCLSITCNNELTEFELKRIDVKFSWQRFCIKCRTYKSRIKGINCQECNKDILVIPHSNMKIYCDVCAKKRHNESRKPKNKL